MDGDKKDDGNDVDMDIAEQTTTSKVTGKRDGMKKFLWKIHCAIGRALDAWLLVNDNLRKWESKMTASERRILITWWVAKGMDFIMHEDQEGMRVGCFERTGCLITFLVSDEYDKKIRPQGIEPGSFDVPIDGSLLEGADAPENEVTPPAATPAIVNTEAQLDQLVIREQQYVQDDNDDEDSLVGEYGRPEGEEELEDVTE